MANTTNYNWETPDDTDLVKDGAAAIRTLGSAIDTTVFNNASAAIAKSIVDAKGDLISATAADTPARLAVGTDGQVLLADSSTATGLKWGTAASGGMTLISTTSLSGASTTISSIPTTYKNLQLIFRDMKDTSATTRFQIQMNADTTANGHSGVMMYANQNTSTGGTGTYTSTAARINWAQPADQNTDVFATVNIFDYTSSTSYKAFEINCKYITGNDPENEFASYFYNRDTAITSIKIISVSGTTLSGTVLLYGVS